MFKKLKFIHFVMVPVALNVSRFSLPCKVSRRNVTIAITGAARAKIKRCLLKKMFYVIVSDCF